MSNLKKEHGVRKQERRINNNDTEHYYYSVVMPDKHPTPCFVDLLGVNSTRLVPVVTWWEVCLAKNVTTSSLCPSNLLGQLCDCVRTWHGGFGSHVVMTSRTRAAGTFPCLSALFPTLTLPVQYSAADITPSIPHLNQSSTEEKKKSLSTIDCLSLQRPESLLKTSKV